MRELQTRVREVYLAPQYTLAIQCKKGLEEVYNGLVRLRINPEYLRCSMFGLEDALVSTTGVVVGISTGIQDKSIILLASLVTVAVEAISMAAGQYSSERAVHELQKDRGHKDSSTRGALIMLASYSLGGAIPVIPTILLFYPLTIVGTIIAAFVSLFALGFIKGKIVHVQPTRSALEILTIGGVAAAIGIIVGYFLRVS